jgi:hypothetical protein
MIIPVSDKSAQLVSSNFMGNVGCLIPALLPTERPSALITRHWNKFSGPDNVRRIVDIERVFRFPFLPAGVFSLVLVRLFEFQPILALWKNGLLSGGQSPQRCTCFLMDRSLNGLRSEL